MSHWEHYEHEADIGIRGVGSDITAAFTQAALALTAIVTDLENITPSQAINVECQADEADILFVDWLNEIIYAMATNNMVFCDYDVHIDNTKLRATLRGEKVENKKHKPAVETKGATYTTLSVHKNDRGEWIAQTVIDV